MTIIADPEIAALEPSVDDGSQLSHVFADLLPPEIRAQRRLRHLKRRLIFVPVALLLIIGMGDVLAHQETASARADLASVQGQGTTLDGQLGQFTHLLNAQAAATTIQGQLATLMTGDLSWSELLKALQRYAPDGVHLGSIAGTATAPDAGGDAAATEQTTTGGQPIAGTVTISGTAPDYRTVAAYATTLSSLTGFADVNPGSIGAGTGSDKSFTITISLTDAALGGRFTAATTTPATVPADPAATGTAPVTGTGTPTLSQIGGN